MPKIPFKGWYPGYQGAPPVGAGEPIDVTEEEYKALTPPTPAPTPIPTPTTPTPPPTPLVPTPPAPIPAPVPAPTPPAEGITKEAGTGMGLPPLPTEGTAAMVGAIRYVFKGGVWVEEEGKPTLPEKEPFFFPKDEEEELIVEEPEEKPPKEPPDQLVDLIEDLGRFGFEYDIDTGELTAAPAIPTFEDDFAALRDEHGMEAVEIQLNTVKADERNIEAQMRAALKREEERLVSIGTIRSAQLKIREEYREELESLSRRKQALIDEYNTKANIINTIMSLKQMDYSAAVADYNTKFNQAVKLLDILAGRETREDQKANQQKTDATANFNLLTSMIQESGTSWADVDDDVKSQIMKLSNIMELPYSVVEAFMQNNQGTNWEPVAQSTSYDADGREFISFWLRDKTDPTNMKQQKYYTGGKKTGAAAKVSDAERRAKANIFLAGKKAEYSQQEGWDGYISAADYMELVGIWTDLEGSPSDLKAIMPPEGIIGKHEYKNLPSYWRPGAGAAVTPFKDLPAEQQVFINQLQHAIDIEDVTYDEAAERYPEIAVYLKTFK